MRIIDWSSDVGSSDLLRAQAVGYKLKSRVAIVIQAAHQSRMAGPSDARRIQPFRHLGEEISRFGGKKCVNVRRAVGGGTVPRFLAVQDAQRIARKTIETAPGQSRTVGTHSFNQRPAT